MPDKFVDAIIAGNLEEVRRLLDQSSAHLMSSDRNSRTPLHVAVRESKPEITELLLERGAVVDAITAHRLTPVHFSCIFDSPKCLEVLLKHGANVELKDFGGWKAIHYASNYGCVAGAELLLDAGCTVSDASTELGYLPLHFASRCGKVVIVKKLLLAGADVNCLSGLKLTPLHLACQGDHDDVVDLLIQNGANKSAPDEAGILPGEFTKSSQVKTLLLQGQ